MGGFIAAAGPEAVARGSEGKLIGSQEPQNSIAVLPFSTLSPGGGDDYFSDGLAEDVIDALAHIPGLNVIARTSSFAFRGKDQDFRKIADVLHVWTILTGSVAGRVAVFALRCNSSMRGTDITCGRSATTATLPTCLRFRMRSRMPLRDP